jgi:hypothetical protein
MLQQLKDTKHSTGWIDDEDVPEELRSHNGTKDDEYSWDSNAEARYNWVLNEMIWAFKQKTLDDDTAEFYDHTESEKEEDIMKSLEKLKVDRVGLEAHEKRKENGYRLFGKYFQTLWD